jgi:hypothetical protein
MDPHMDRTTEMNVDATPNDLSALLMMLAYVEAECRRLGAEAAAEYAAMAAAMVPDAPVAPPAGTGAALH